LETRAFFDKTLMYASLLFYNCQSSFSYAKKLHKRRERIFWKTINKVELWLMPLKCLYYCQKVIQSRYTTMKFLHFHLLQRELHLSSKETVLSNWSQKGCEMLEFNSWGYESVIRCFHSLTQPLIRLRPHTLLLNCRVHYWRAAYSWIQEIYWRIPFICNIIGWSLSTYGYSAWKCGISVWTGFIKSNFSIALSNRTCHC
jgi:hypothetical protein